MDVTGQVVGALRRLRVGQGFDVHRFSDDPSRPLVLGGVRFDGERGLDGHSDADAIAHAITDALLSAADLGDIGEHFPDTDPTWRGADSMQMLSAVVALVGRSGYQIVNVDCTLIAESPRVSPRKAEIVSALMNVIDAPVTVKGRRAEKLGALGRREGVGALAVALLIGPADPDRRTDAAAPDPLHDRQGS